MATEKAKSYGKMLTEVEQIIHKMGEDDCDLDKMVQQLERGYQLIDSMRTRLDETNLKIENLREKNQASAEGSP